MVGDKLISPIVVLKKNQCKDSPLKVGWPFPPKNATFDPAHIWFSLRWGFEQLICFSWRSCWDHYSHCLQEIRQRIAARAEGVLRDLGRSCWWNHIFVNLHHTRSCHISKYPIWYFLQKLGVINISISKSNWNTNFTAMMTLPFKGKVEMILWFKPSLWQETPAPDDHVSRPDNLRLGLRPCAS